ncbi:MAG TPA: glycosyltransferase family A protein [Pyrinomonadaceae bacterium]|jgi:alpha-1,3-rhamnosyltransferase|nr:glycosyltransferase family A protein [Pyrinomonadaceae bacterium]
MRNDEGVTVAVPSYNHARFVGQTLRSVFRQTHAPARLLVIDDGSRDDSARVIERELAACPFPCDFVARENRGLCVTLNEALSLTRTPYFAYLGSDDLWLPDFLRERVRLLQSRPRAVLAYGHCLIVDGENRVVDSTSDWASYADGDARPMLLTTVSPMSPTVVYRRAALEGEGWREDARLEDYDLYLRLSASGEFAFDPRPLAAWRRHGSNTSRDQRMMLDEHLAAQRRVLPLQGFDEADIGRFAARVSFARAEDFLRLGDRRAALGLISRNLSGAASARHAARVLLRFLLPQSLLRRRRLARERQSAERYGRIKI